jgi:acyl-homoserine lactone acylase PvdQ
MTQVFARAFAFFLFLSAAACTQQADPEFARLEERAARVEIIRDDFGVPHVLGYRPAGRSRGRERYLQRPARAALYDGR